jgi:hypothetical protein
LTSEIGRLNKSELGASLRAMRSACRKFLDAVGGDDRDIVRYATQNGHYAGWIFYSALGEMRGTFGVHLARIATRFQLDVEDELAVILPAKAERESESPPAPVGRQRKTTGTEKKNRLKKKRGRYEL